MNSCTNAEITQSHNLYRKDARISVLYTKSLSESLPLPP